MPKSRLIHAMKTDAASVDVTGRKVGTNIIHLVERKDYCNIYNETHAGAVVLIHFTPICPNPIVTLLNNFTVFICFLYSCSSVLFVVLL